MSLEQQSFLPFGPFRLDLTRRLLFRGDEAIQLRPRVFDTLLVLARKPGDIAPKEELLEAVWPDTVVEENNLNQNVLALRRVLERHPEDGVRIETVARRGYRLIAPAPEEASPPVAVSPVPTPVVGGRRRLALAALAMAAVVLVTGAIWRLRRVGRPISGVRSIAVLPLKSLGADAQDELGLGLADAVITRLGFVRALSVRPTSAVRSLPAGESDPVAAGRLLRVDAVLDGQIQKAGERLRVTVQLVSVRSGASLWSGKFDVKTADLFSVEDSLSEELVKALTSDLSVEETRRVGRDRPTAPEAYRAYLEGRVVWNQRTVASYERARQLFERAIALDPSYAPAYAGLADALNSEIGDPRLARQAAERALALDDSVAEAYAALGNTSLFTDWNFAEAEKNFRKAIDLNPSYATAHQWYAYCFLVHGDLPGAAREVRRAQEADPLSPSIGVDVAYMLYYGRRYEEAVSEVRRVLELQPGFGQALQVLPIFLLAKGDRVSASRECAGAAPLGPDFLHACEAVVAVSAGDRAVAQEHFEAIAARPRFTVLEAEIALAGGDLDRALKALEECYNRRYVEVLLVGADPRFDALRSDPRFLQLLGRMGVTPLPRS
jgi:DNA-binding winged helix-turn-helix (wHTH) protein/TolB-like protein/Tfp pilus assembly protein PilF